MAWTSAAKKTSAADDAEVQPADADSPTYLLTYILAHLLTYDYSPSHLLTRLPTYLRACLLTGHLLAPLDTASFTYLPHTQGRSRRRGAGRWASRAVQVIVVAHPRRLPAEPLAESLADERHGHRTHGAACAVELWWGLCTCRPCIALWLCRYRSSLDIEFSRHEDERGC